MTTLPARRSRSTALDDKGDVDGAIAQYREAIHLKPDYALAHYNLGNALYRKGDGQAAQEEFRRAFELDPDGAMAEYREAIAWSRATPMRTNS